MRDEIDGGTIRVKNLVEAAKGSKDVLAAVETSDEVGVIMTLSILRTLESKGSDRASEAMARQLGEFVEAKFPNTERSEQIREKIREYAAGSPAFKALKQQRGEGSASH